MAKIGLIYLNDQPDISMGLAYISAVLKQNGHEVLLWDTYYKNDEIIIEEMIKSDIQIAMFSVHSMAYKHSLKIINAIKEIKANLPILVGGWHTLIDPEGILNQPSVDMICVGEGEYAALDVANDLDKTNLANIDKIPNIWSKKDGKIIRNPARKLDNLDNLPYPDRDIFHKDSIKNKSLLNRLNHYPATTNSADLEELVSFIGSHKNGLSSNMPIFNKWQIVAVR